MKICTILGARPQFIKASALSREIYANNHIQECIVHTGQHYDANMSDNFFKELDIPQPKYSLNIGSGQHGAQTGKMLAGIEDILLAEKPDYVVVYGDTNSTLAGALAAAKLHIPIAHIEAGLRSFNRKMPEEINRVMADHLSQILFTPTDIASRNLTREGISSEKIMQVGDIMYDVTRFYREQSQRHNKLMDTLQIEHGHYVLATIHRAENTDDVSKLESIMRALIELSEHIDIVLPLHPRTLKIISTLPYFSMLKDSVKLIEPVGYLDMLALEQHAKLIITDSGGVQKEAYFHGVPCVTLRDETEWVELVESGWNHLSPVTKELSLLNYLSLNSEALSYSPFYGDGFAANKILNALSQHLSTEVL